MAARLDWGRVKFIGWLFLTLGLVSIVLPTAATIAVEQVIAWLLVATGISGLSLWWRLEGEASRWSLGAVFALTLLLGLLFAFFPTVGVRSLTMLMAIIFLFEGMASIFFGYQLRERLNQWGWFAFSGAASLLMGLVILLGWPDTASWIIGFLLGVNLLTTGLALVMMARVGVEEIDIDLRG